MKSKLTTLALVLVMFFTLTAESCDPKPPTSDQVQRQKQETLSQQSNMVVGMPAITKFAEKRMLKDIIELRDSMPPTYTYIVDMNGHLHKICDSIGFGFSGATQFTNPQRIASSSDVHGYGFTAIPQADPNGLFSPSSDEGTWIMCKNPHGSNVAPIRMEPRSIVSPFSLE